MSKYMPLINSCHFSSPLEKNAIHRKDLITDEINSLTKNKHIMTFSEPSGYSDVTYLFKSYVRNELSHAIEKYGQYGLCLAIDTDASHARILSEIANEMGVWILALAKKEDEKDIDKSAYLESIFTDNGCLVYLPRLNDKQGNDYFYSLLTENSSIDRTGEILAFDAGDIRPGVLEKAERLRIKITTHSQPNIFTDQYRSHSQQRLFSELNQTQHRNVQLLAIIRTLIINISLRLIEDRVMPVLLTEFTGKNRSGIDKLSQYHRLLHETYHEIKQLYECEGLRPIEKVRELAALLRYLSQCGSNYLLPDTQCYIDNLLSLFSYVAEQWETLSGEYGMEAVLDESTNLLKQITPLLGDLNLNGGEAAANLAKLRDFLATLSQGCALTKQLIVAANETHAADAILSTLLGSSLFQGTSIDPLLAFCKDIARAVTGLPPYPENSTLAAQSLWLSNVISIPEVRGYIREKVGDDWESILQVAIKFPVAGTFINQISHLLSVAMKICGINGWMQNNGQYIRERFYFEEQTLDLLKILFGDYIQGKTLGGAVYDNAFAISKVLFRNASHHFSGPAAQAVASHYLGPAAGILTSTIINTCQHRSVNDSWSTLSSKFGSILFAEFTASLTKDELYSQTLIVAKKLAATLDQSDSFEDSIAAILAHGRVCNESTLYFLKKCLNGSLGLRLYQIFNEPDVMVQKAQLRTLCIELKKLVGIANWYYLINFIDLIPMLPDLRVFIHQGSELSAHFNRGDSWFDLGQHLLNDLATNQHPQVQRLRNELSEKVETWGVQAILSLTSSFDLVNPVPEKAPVSTQENAGWSSGITDKIGKLVSDTWRALPTVNLGILPCADAAPQPNPLARRIVIPQSAIYSVLKPVNQPLKTIVATRESDTPEDIETDDEDERETDYEINDDSIFDEESEFDENGMNQDEFILDVLDDNVKEEDVSWYKNPVCIIGIGSTLAAGAALYYYLKKNQSPALSSTDIEMKNISEWRRDAQKLLKITDDNGVCLNTLSDDNGSLATDRMLMPSTTVTEAASPERLQDSRSIVSALKVMKSQNEDSTTRHSLVGKNNKLAILNKYKVPLAIEGVTILAAIFSWWYNRSLSESKGVSEVQLNAQESLELKAKLDLVPSEYLDAAEYRSMRTGRSVKKNEKPASLFTLREIAYLRRNKLPVHLSINNFIHYLEVKHQVKINKDKPLILYKRITMHYDQPMNKESYEVSIEDFLNDTSSEFKYKAISLHLLISTKLLDDKFILDDFKQFQRRTKATISSSISLFEKIKQSEIEEYRKYKGNLNGFIKDQIESVLRIKSTTLVEYYESGKDVPQSCTLERAIFTLEPTITIIYPAEWHSYKTRRCIEKLENFRVASYMFNHSEKTTLSAIGNITGSTLAPLVSDDDKLKKELGVEIVDKSKEAFSKIEKNTPKTLPKIGLKKSFQLAYYNIYSCPGNKRENALFIEKVIEKSRKKECEYFGKRNVKSYADVMNGFKSIIKNIENEQQTSVKSDLNIQKSVILQRKNEFNALYTDLKQAKVPVIDKESIVSYVVASRVAAMRHIFRASQVSDYAFADDDLYRISEEVLKKNPAFKKSYPLLIFRLRELEVMYFYILKFKKDVPSGSDYIHFHGASLFPWQSHGLTEDFIFSILCQDHNPVSLPYLRRIYKENNDDIEIALNSQNFKSSNSFSSDKEFYDSFNEGYLKNSLIKDAKNLVVLNSLKQSDELSKGINLSVGLKKIKAITPVDTDRLLVKTFEAWRDAMLSSSRDSIIDIITDAIQKKDRCLAKTTSRVLKKYPITREAVLVFELLGNSIKSLSDAMKSDMETADYLVIETQDGSYYVVSPVNSPILPSVSKITKENAGRIKGSAKTYINNKINVEHLLYVLNRTSLKETIEVLKQEKKDKTVAECLASLIPFYDVIKRSIDDSRYITSMEDWFFDVLDLTITLLSIGIPVAKLGTAGIRASQLVYKEGIKQGLKKSMIRQQIYQAAKPYLMVAAKTTGKEAASFIIPLYDPATAGLSSLKKRWKRKNTGKINKKPDNIRARPVASVVCPLAKRVARSPCIPLSFDESEALLQYTRAVNGYKNINGYLRKKVRLYSADLTKTIQNIDSALKQIPAAKGPFYRFNNRIEVEFLKDNSIHPQDGRKFVAGAEVTFQSYLSTSINSFIKQDGNNLDFYEYIKDQAQSMVLYEIRGKNRAHPLPDEFVEKKFGDESEALFERGTTFVINKIEEKQRIVNGRAFSDYYVKMEEIGSNPVRLLESPDVGNKTVMKKDDGIGSERSEGTHMEEKFKALSFCPLTASRTKRQLECITLSANEQAALHKYTHYESGKVNSYLRLKKNLNSIYLNKLVRDIDGALRNIPPYKGHVHRIGYYHEVQFLKNNVVYDKKNMKFVIGSEVTFQGYLSTSILDYIPGWALNVKDHPQSVVRYEIHAINRAHHIPYQLTDVSEIIGEIWNVENIRNNLSEIIKTDNPARLKELTGIDDENRVFEIKRELGILAENEVLFERGTRFRITRLEEKKRFTSRGTKVIDLDITMEEVGGNIVQMPGHSNSGLMSIDEGE
ncbi:ADP-ribosyltransferase [Izhakiella australiensis]|nr:ADP-ribosyltransferase [Izhakiella australiensis]